MFKSKIKKFNDLEKTEKNYEEYIYHPFLNESATDNDCSIKRSSSYD